MIASTTAMPQRPPMTIPDATSPLDPDAAWAAVIARDRRADGTFVFAVATTGVYCRPSCAARRPNRANVAFFVDGEAARGAGFRACLRCRPDQEAADVALVRRVCAELDARLDERVSLAELGALLGASPSHLQRTFRRAMGLSPAEYARAQRNERWKRALRRGDSVTDAIFDAGFGAVSRAYENAPARLGMTPSDYARGGLGQEIRYTIVPSRLGKVLVAATARGLAAVAFGDNEQSLEAQLADDLPRAARLRDDGALSAWIAPILAAIEEPETNQGRALEELPLDLRGTAFEERVWRELRRIPWGETRTYGEVAVAVGQPTAARAVANACAKNRAALAIPCHRVVRSDGAAGGYRWGAERKREILARERKQSAEPAS